MTTNCFPLTSYTGFPDYIATLHNVTGDNITVSSMQQCRREICSTLYGVGNADISGIGVVVAYIINLVLATIIALGIISSTGDAHSRRTTLIYRAYTKYADGATMLAFSVQLAAAILIINKSYGTSAVDFGQLIADTTWSAALVTILPMQLAYCIAPPPTRDEEHKGRDAHDLMLIWVTMTWLLFLIIFVCEMTQHYAAGQVGEGPGAVISDDEAANIFELCFAGVNTSGLLSGTTGEAFEIGGSLYASLLGVGLLWDAWVGIKHRAWRVEFWQAAGRRRLAGILAVAATLFWGIPLIIAILQHRQVQASLARSLAVGTDDDRWSFGQIVAVVVFLPVLFEVLYQWCLGDGSSKRQSESRLVGG